VRAKEIAKEKSVAAKDRVLGSPIALGVAGGLLTMGISSLIIKRRRAKWEAEEPEFELAPETFESMGPETFEGVAPETVRESRGYIDEELEEPSRVDRVKEKVGDLKGDLKEKVSGWKEKAGDLGHQARDFAENATHTGSDKLHQAADEWPLAFSLGAVAAGLLLGLVIPVSETERRVFSKAGGGKLDELRDRFGQKVSDLQTKMEQKVGSVADELADKLDEREGDQGLPINREGIPSEPF
jgi:hypothetical protein